MNIQPLGDRVLVKVFETEQTTASGIVLPDSAKEKKAEGEIVALGEGEELKKLNLSAGDKVLFGKYSGDDVAGDDNDDNEYKILKHEEVLAVVK